MLMHFEPWTGRQQRAKRRPGHSRALPRYALQRYWTAAFERRRCWLGSERCKGRSRPSSVSPKSLVCCDSAFASAEALTFNRTRISKSHTNPRRQNPPLKSTRTPVEHRAFSGPVASPGGTCSPPRRQQPPHGVRRGERQCHALTTQPWQISPVLQIFWYCCLQQSVHTGCDSFWHSRAHRRNLLLQIIFRTPSQESQELDIFTQRANHHHQFSSCSCLEPVGCERTQPLLAVLHAPIRSIQNTQWLCVIFKCTIF